MRVGRFIVVAGLFILDGWGIIPLWKSGCARVGSSVRNAVRRSSSISLAKGSLLRQFRQDF